MKKIETMDRNACEQVRAALVRALEASPELKALGVAARARGATFDPMAGLVTFKIEVGIVKEGGRVVSRESAMWASGAPLFNLPVDALGKQIVVNGRTFTIEGLKVAARKMPVCLKGDDGRSYKMAAEQVRRALGLPPTVQVG